MSELKTPIEAEKSLTSPAIPSQSDILESQSSPNIDEPSQPSKLEEEDAKQPEDDRPLDLEDIFLGLKEPTHAPQTQEQKRDEMADKLTQTLFQVMMSEMGSNLFPPRVHLPSPSPVAQQISPVSTEKHEEIKDFSVESPPTDLTAKNDKDAKDSEEEHKIEDTANTGEEVKEEEPIVPFSSQVPKIPKLRGIKTTHPVVEAYI
jgi:hypothetical protein